MKHVTFLHFIQHIFGVLPHLLFDNNSLSGIIFLGIFYTPIYHCYTFGHFHLLATELVCFSCCELFCTRTFLNLFLDLLAINLEVKLLGHVVTLCLAQGTAQMFSQTEEHCQQQWIKVLISPHSYCISFPGLLHQITGGYNTVVLTR